MNRAVVCCKLLCAMASLFLLSGCSSTPLLAPQPTPMLFPSVTDLLREHPVADKAVQVDAYYSKYIPGTTIPSVPADEIGCPEYFAILADEPLPSCELLVSGDYICSAPAAGFPSVQVVLPSQLTPGQDILPPSLPYHARFAGHLGDPKLAHCPDNERIFVVDWVAQVYEEKFPTATP